MWAPGLRGAFGNSATTPLSVPSPRLGIRSSHSRGVSQQVSWKRVSGRNPRKASLRVLPWTETQFSLGFPVGERKVRRQLTSTTRPSAAPGEQPGWRAPSLPSPQGSFHIQGASRRGHLASVPCGGRFAAGLVSVPVLMTRQVALPLPWPGGPAGPGGSRRSDSDVVGWGQRRL